MNTQSIPQEQHPLAALLAPKSVGSELLSRQQAADYLGITAGTLACWASNKRYNLPFVKVGRSVRYRLSALQVFIEARTVGGEQSGAAA
jgi:excisionase family DNA binding protein